MSPNRSHSAFEIVHFAEFEANLRTCELRRGDQLLKLQGKPFQVLAALLARPGELITREELRQSVWPADTFVDFEHGLNTAVNKVREVLRDSASNPRFIETLPRRGYRFIGTVSSKRKLAMSEHVATEESSNATQAQPDVDELPKASRFTARGLLILIELGYFVSYIAALHYLLWVRMLARFSFGPVQALTVTSGIVLWCAMGMPIRFYLLFALAFDYHLLGEKFRHLFPFLLVVDEFWSGMTLFLVPNIGLGFGFTLFVAAIYSPFAQRTLVRMGYR
jgi:DNA-binding winged helix-turn-helix (wHTH) protein